MTSKCPVRVSKFWLLFVASVLFVVGMTAPIWLVLWTHDINYSNATGAEFAKLTAHVYVTGGLIWYGVSWFRRRRAHRAEQQQASPSSQATP